MSARTAVFVIFVLNGATYGSWAARVPALTTQVGATEGTLGLALLGSSVGMVLMAPFAGRICARLGERLVLALASGLASLLLPLLGLAGSPVQLGVVLFGMGLLVCLWDVAMNVAAAEVGRVLDRPLMPQFHSGFSFGGLLGSAAAGLAATAGWSPLRHLAAVAVLSLAAIGLVARALPGAASGRPTPDAVPAAPGPAPIRQPVLWLLAGIALCAAIAEGASSDWSALFLVTERGSGEGAAAIAFSGFAVAMALTRLLGEPAQRRWGPFRLLGTGAVVAAVGLATAVLVPVAATAYAGFVLAGMGLAFAFPLVMDLASRVGRRPDGTGGQSAIGFVTAVSYTGFLAGPPLVGGLAQASSLTVSMAVVAAVAALMAPTVWLAHRAVRRGAAEPSQPARSSTAG
ncbi:MFS transporter [Goodfellowiella coeruleoviolacea]|uniref:MFS transporter n=1 Tax=Goodfellowiella coeruleoviolacea TaxID=334858 RepID=UPI0020A5BB5C